MGSKVIISIVALIILSTLVAKSHDPPSKASLGFKAYCIRVTKRHPLGVTTRNPLKRFPNSVVCLVLVKGRCLGFEWGLGLEYVSSLLSSEHVVVLLLAVGKVGLTSFDTVMRAGAPTLVSRSSHTLNPKF